MWNMPMTVTFLGAVMGWVSGKPWGVTDGAGLAFILWLVVAFLHVKLPVEE